MRKPKRKQQLKNRNNFLPTFIITLLFWAITASFIYFVNPAIPCAVPFFIFILFLSLLLTFSLLLDHSRRGLLISLSLTIFLVLRYFGIGNLLNLFLLTGIIIAFEIYLSTNS